MNIVDRTYDLISRGRSPNRPPSIPTGYSKYDVNIYGIRQGQYILIGGETGTGKSYLVRSTYIHNVYNHFKRINDPSVLDVQFVDFSLEIPAEINLSHAITRKLWEEHRKVLPVSKLHSWEEARLSQEDFDLASGFKEYFYEMHRKLAVIDQETTPQIFHDVLMEVALTNGTFSSSGSDISRCGVYTPHNPNKFIIVLFDTLNLADMEESYAKAVMDRISRYAVWFRNKCNFTFIIVQQFNSDMDAASRSGQRDRGFQQPVLKDFMDTTRPTKDANVVIGLYAPYKHYKPPTGLSVTAETEQRARLFRGYDILRLQDWFVSLHVMKNRYGRPSIWLPLKFDGELGLFTDLPHALNMNDEEYRKATNH